MIVRELITKIGFDYDGSALKKAEAGIFSLKNGLIALAGLVTAGAVAKFFTSAADSAEALIKSSQKTGIGVESLQRLGYAAYLADIDMSTLDQSMGFLSKSLVSAREGSKEAGDAFKKILGKNVNLKSFKDNEQLLLALSEQFQKMPDGAEKAALSMKIFGRAGKDMIPFLNQGPDAIRAAGDELQAFGGVLGIDALQAGNTFNDGLKRMRTFFLSLRNVIAAKIFPVINEVIDRFVEWLKVNKDIIRSRLEDVFLVIGNALKDIGQIIGYVIKGYNKLSEAIGGTQAAIAALVAFAVIALGPTGAAIAAIGTAIFLLVDDVLSFLRGEPSFFEPVYLWIQELVKKIEEGVKQIKATFADWKIVIETDLIPALKKIQPIIDFLVSDGVKNFIEMSNWLIKIIGLVKDLVIAFDEVRGKIVEGLGLSDIIPKSGFGSLKDSILNAIIPGGNLLGGLVDANGLIQARASDIRSGQGGNTSKTQNNNLKVEQKIEVNVQTGADPNGIAQSIQDQSAGPLGELLRNASYDLESGAEN